MEGSVRAKQSEVRLIPIMKLSRIVVLLHDVRESSWGSKQ